MHSFAAWVLAVYALPMAAGDLVRVGIVVLEDGGHVSSAAQNEMRLETARVFVLEGVRFEWPGTNEIERGKKLDRIVVVRFAGVGESGITLQGEGGSLGAAEVRDGRALPFVTVDVERVRGVVGRSRVRGHLDRNLGRALGRVLAHELYHALSGSLEHDQDGVAQASLSGDELTRDHVQLGVAARTRVVQGLRSIQPLD